ncbi:hypothetical protein [Nocardiopsis ganjiahuensis]|uniref:hypothetical protein n=1 Tax=Nocardiopsis ganjiahuensis TaxID=239984 RepID=UPI00034A5D88|nr:hypothetical protein [Nocardiopsis ganjiahuensis]
MAPSTAAETTRTRRGVRRFRPDPIPGPLQHQLPESTVQAPSGRDPRPAVAL